MNEEDKKRFARYRPDYKEPLEGYEELDANNTVSKIKPNSTSKESKNTLGYIEQININPNDLVNQVISELEHKIPKNTPNQIQSQIKLLNLI